jgi:branched-chain amino acid transport system ATP-binding protein
MPIVHSQVRTSPGEPAPPALLQVAGLHYAYNGAVAVRGVSLEVGRAEIVALLGSNGAGKSTTVKMIAGALQPQAGSILFEGRPLHGVSSHVVVRRGITLVPEGRLVFPQMTVFENLLMGAHTLPTQEAIDENLDYVFGIFPRLNERKVQVAGSMSGGEQQMLAIARGLMSSPKLMILDEPSLGLMPMLVQDLFRLIRQVSQRGISILLVEQNVHQSLQIAHRAYVLEKGEVVLSGTGEALLDNAFVQKAFLGR